MTALDVRPLIEGRAFGARIGGLTMAQTKDPDVRRQINDLFEAKGVIVFEDVEPSGEMHVALSDVFGPLKEHPSKAVPRVGRRDHRLRAAGMIENREPAVDESDRDAALARASRNSRFAPEATGAVGPAMRDAAVDEVEPVLRDRTAVRPKDRAKTAHRRRGV